MIADAAAALACVFAFATCVLAIGALNRIDELRVDVKATLLAVTRTSPARLPRAQRDANLEALSPTPRLPDEAGG